MSSAHYESPDAFLRKMDSGELDGILHTEIKKLSPEHLEEVALEFMRRDANLRELGITEARETRRSSRGSSDSTPGTQI